MDNSTPEVSAARLVVPRAVLAGAALSLSWSAAVRVLLLDALVAAGALGVAATAAVALAVGVWAGGPLAQREEPAVRERWAAAGLAMGAAGAFGTAWRLYGMEAGGVVARVLALLLLVALPTYILGLLLPVLLAWAEGIEEMLEEEEEGWGVLGALVVGALSGVALGTVAAGALLPLFGAGPLLLATSVLLLIPLLLPDPEVSREEDVLFQRDTPFSSLRVTEARPGNQQPERRLYLNGEEESAELVRTGVPTLAYIAAAETWLASSTPRGGRYLVLGGGAYTLPRRLAERDPDARITVVELDPEVTRVAYRFFGLRREHGIVSVHGDGRWFLESGEGSGAYDRVYVDVYTGGEALPYSLVTREAFAALRRQLREGGVAAMNLIGMVQGSEAPRLWSVVRTFRTVFPSVALYSHLGPDFPDRQNLLLAGSPDPAYAFAARAGRFDRWPEEQWPSDLATVVFRDLAVFSAHDARRAEEVEPNDSLPSSLEGR